MANTSDKMFYGDGRLGDWNPRDYLKKVKRSFVGKANVAEADKVAMFELSLASGSVAEAWYDALNGAQLVSWATLDAAFNTKWPKEVLEEKTAQEMSEEMLELELPEDEMGKRIEVDGISMYGHIRWTKRMAVLSEKDTTGFMIPLVRKKLPQAMRELVGNQYKTWPTFLKAIADVSVPDLQEAMEKEKRLRSFDTALNSSPTAPLRTALAKTTISVQPFPTRVYVPTPTASPSIRRVQPPTNPFRSSAPIHPSNLFAQGRTPARFPPTTPTRFVPTTERLPILERNMLPHHPNTPAGLAVYAQQVTAYTARYGQSPPNEYRPYPLTPGTQPLDSGACFSCAQLGHMAKDREGNTTCPNPTTLPEAECKWRNIASYIYRTGRGPASPAPADMRFVSPMQPFYDPNTHSYYTLDYGDHDYTYEYAEEQGKGPGSSE